MRLFIEALVIFFGTLLVAALVALGLGPQVLAHDGAPASITAAGDAVASGAPC